MRAADLPQVLQIERSACLYPWSEGVLRDCLRAGYGCFVTGDERGALIAYLVVSCAAGEANLLNLCVHPQRQRQGFASALLRFAIDYVAANGAETIFLEVRPSNRSALRLYQRYGFNEVGCRPHYYPAQRGREDALIMARIV